jgi:hypothetical protein
MATVFKLKSDPTFRATVDVPVAGHDTMPLEVEFRHKRRAEMQEWFESFASRDELDCLMEIINGWFNVDAPFSRDNLDELLQEYPQAAKTIAAAYTAQLTGFRLGN